MADLTLGQRIAEERKKLGLSQEALGDKLCVSRQAISKWESDAAVPEIDKLISLSKLFGVSIGWLLGVEEKPEQKENELSEAQLEVVEELVRKYQNPPAPRLSIFHYMFAIIASLLIFLFIYGQTSRIERTLQNVVDTEDYSRLAARVAALEASSGNVDTVVGSLLADYSFKTEPAFSIASGSCDAVIVSVSATPHIWQNSDRGYFSVRLDGQEVQRQECRWDGSYLTAQVGVDLQNGYEYCFLLLRSDGSQEQQILYNETAQNLKDAFSITLDVTPGKMSYADGVLTLLCDQLSAVMPPACRNPDGTPRSDVCWTKLECVLYRATGDVTEIGRDDLTDRISEAVLNPQLLLNSQLIQFRDVELTEDTEYLQLWLYAELNNGLTQKCLIEVFMPDGNGGLRLSGSPS